MNKNIKLIGMVLFIGILSLTAIASADSDLYDITKVEVNDVEVTDGTTVSGVELDDSVEIKVYIEGTGTSSTCPDGDVDDCAVDVKVKTWIGGYEYEDIEAVSNTFSIEPGVTYTKTLTLDLPSDMDVDNNDYTLYVEVYDSEDEERESYSLYAERPEHSLEIMDVIYDPTVKAGETTSVEVRVENLGNEKEDDIKVEALLGDLVSASDYIDELAAYEEDNEDEESSDSASLLLSVPDDATEGSYTITIKVSYNRGHDVIEETYIVSIEGEEQTPEESETTVSLSTTSFKGEQDEEGTLTLTFSNEGSSSATYTVSANGISQWATSQISPDMVTVAPSSTEKVTITLTPDSEASGSYDWSIQILDSDGNLVKDIAMTASISEDSGLFSDASLWLKIGFVILIVLIVMIAIIAAVRKLKDDDDDDDELEPKEGKTYY
jgi:hypothetical protein